MRSITLITVGGAVGFVLGARAGRPTYDRLARAYSEFTATVGLHRAGQSVAAASAELGDAVAGRASFRVRQAGDGVASGLRDVATSVRRDSDTRATG